MPSNQYPWLVMTTEVFVSPLMSSVPSGLFTAGKQFNLTWNQTKQSEAISGSSLWFSPGALPLGYLFYLMKDENHRCVECLWKSGDTMKDCCRAMTGKFREYIMTHGWWWYWFSLMCWLISAVTGCFFRNHREEEHCGNNTHGKPIKITNVFKQVNTIPQEGRLSLVVEDTV